MWRVCSEHCATDRKPSLERKVASLSLVSTAKVRAWEAPLLEKPVILQGTEKSGALPGPAGNAAAGSGNVTLAYNVLSICPVLWTAGTVSRSTPSEVAERSGGKRIL